MKIKSCILGLLLAVNLPAWGTFSYGTLNSDPAIGVIPDNNTIGFSDAHTLGGLGDKINELTLTFVLKGGFASDLSGYLRLGNTGSSPSYDLTSLVQSQSLSESSPNTYTVNFSTTTFGSALSTAFNNQNPNSTWTMFFADTSAGGQTTLNGWSLDITAVPEPVTLALGCFAFMLLALSGLRWARQPKS